MTSTLSRPRNPPLEVPPPVEWEVWRARFLRQWKQGDHLLDVGPTQSGKSLLMREIVFAGRKNVVVMGTKPKDPTLDEYIEGGFVRIDHWPPEKRDFRAQQDGMARFILWPKIVEIGDVTRFRPLYEKALRSIYVDVSKAGGGWTVVIDETLFFSDAKDGLGLGHILSTMAYSTASSGITMCFLMQRPAGVPRILWQSCSSAFLFHMGVTNDVREMASLGVIQPKAVTEAIQKLEGHTFLDLPCRAGRRWSTSQVRL
jgi:hypothetical protein